VVEVAAGADKRIGIGRRAHYGLTEEPIAFLTVRIAKMADSDQTLDKSQACLKSLCKSV
jgi:hypothetical protein